jgi:hypothetical protein
MVGVLYNYESIVHGLKSLPEWFMKTFANETGMAQRTDTLQEYDLYLSL